MSNLQTPEQEQADSASPRQDFLILGAVCFVCFFWRLGSVGLFDFNEGLYAQAAREMLLRGDWVAGSVNGVLFFDKPPLALWLTAASYFLFGVNEFAARLPVAIAATALVFLTYWFAARHLSRRAGLIAGAALALSPLYVGTARQMTMDIHQSLWFAVAMVCFFEGYSADSARGKRWFYGFWVGCGLSFMAKSVPGLFPIAAAAVFVAIEQRFQLRPILVRIWEAKPLAGLVILTVIIAPWHVAAYQKYGELFYQEYWILHHVGLLTGSDFSHAQPFWYYVPALFAGMFPWSVFLPVAVLAAWRSSRQSESAERATPVQRFLLVWALFVVVIFSVMKSKLVSYLLPMYPAAALLIGDWVTQVVTAGRPKRAFTGSFGVIAVFAAVLLIAGSAALWHFTRPGVEVRGDFPPIAGAWVLPALALLAAGAGVATWRSWRGRTRAAVAALFVGAFGFTTVAVEVGLRTLDREINRPLRQLALAAGELRSTGIPIAIHIASPRRPSVFFYIPDSVFRNEPLIERGETEPILEFLKTIRPAYVIADSGRAEKLILAAPGLEVDRRNGRWVLLHAADSAAPTSP